MHGWAIPANISIRRRCIARFEHATGIDHRGFGRTEWPQDGYWVSRLLGRSRRVADTISPDAPVTMVGHSMGGNLGDALRRRATAPSETRDQISRALDCRRRMPGQAPSAIGNGSRSESRTRFCELRNVSGLRSPRGIAGATSQTFAGERADFIARAWARENEQGRIDCVPTRDTARQSISYPAMKCRGAGGQITDPSVIAAEESSIIAGYVMCHRRKLREEFRNVNLLCRKCRAHVAT